MSNLMNDVVNYEIRIGDLTAVCVPWGASLASLDLGGQQLLRRIPVEAYSTHTGHFGSIAGPIANRVRDGEVLINGVRISTRLVLHDAFTA